MACPFKVLNMNLRDVRVEEVMTSPPIVARRNETISTVMSRIREHGIHEMPVVDENGNLVGHFSYHMIVRRKNIPISAKVESVMVSAPGITPETSIEEAVEKLIHTGFRVLPVVSGSRVIGVVSRADIINKLREFPEIIKVSVEELMTHQPIVVNEDATYDEAVKKMRNLGEVVLPVVDDNGKLVGMVYLRDIVRGLWREKSRESYGDMAGEKSKLILRVKDVMLPPVYVGKEANLGEVIEKMFEMSSYIVCVVDESMKPIGIITQKDILDYIMTKKPQEGVFVQITGLDIEDIVPYESIYAMVEKFLSKIKDFKRLKPLYLNFHVEEHHATSGEIKYSVRAKLTTESKVFYTKAVDWNLFRAFAETIDQLERMVKREKKRMEERTKVVR